MCMQVDWLYSCNHIAFMTLVKCAEFGRTCYGPPGTHLTQPNADPCFDCRRNANTSQEMLNYPKEYEKRGASSTYKK